VSPGSWWVNISAVVALECKAALRLAISSKAKATATNAIILIGEGFGFGSISWE